MAENINRKKEHSACTVLPSCDCALMYLLGWSLQASIRMFLSQGQVLREMQQAIKYTVSVTNHGGWPVTDDEVHSTQFLVTYAGRKCGKS